MSYTIQTFFIIISSSLFLFIIYHLKMEKLDVKYALVWLFISFLLILFSIFPKIVFFISNLIGIKTPANSLFMLGIFFLLIITFIQNIIISKHKKQIKNISQELGILKYKNEGENN